MARLHLETRVLYQPLVENSHFDWLRLRQIDPPRHPSHEGKGFLVRNAKLRFGVASQSQNGNFQLEAGIAFERYV